MGKYVGGTADMSVISLDTAAVLPHSTVSSRQHRDHLERLVRTQSSTTARRVERLQLTVVT